jgi:hypothetical protein
MHPATRLFVLLTGVASISGLSRLGFAERAVALDLAGLA